MDWLVNWTTWPGIPAPAAVLIWAVTMPGDAAVTVVGLTATIKSATATVVVPPPVPVPVPLPVPPKGCVLDELLPPPQAASASRASVGSRRLKKVISAFLRRSQAGVVGSR